jgi:hypothetical protein
LRFSCRVGDGPGAQWIGVTAFDEKATGQAEKFIKGVRCYVEGTVKLEEWAGSDGAVRHGLGCLSWHCRLAEIGRNKPKRDRKAKITSVEVATPSGAASPAGRADFYSDEVPFAPEWRG